MGVCVRRRLKRRPGERRETKSRGHREERSDEAIHSFIARSDGLVRFARNDDCRHSFSIPRRNAPELCMNDPPNKGRGECRVPVAPAAARVVVVSTRVSHHGRTGTPGIPARDGFNGFLRTLPGDRALLSPSSPRSLLLENLTPTIEASGPHDFAVRARCHSSFDMPRPSHPAPYVRDDRETPLCVGRDGERYAGDLGQKGTGIFLQGGTGRVASD
jgi:hypothetical protein